MSRFVQDILKIRNSIWKMPLVWQRWWPLNDGYSVNNRNNARPVTRDVAIFKCYSWFGVAKYGGILTEIWHTCGQIISFFFSPRKQLYGCSTKSLKLADYNYIIGSFFLLHPLQSYRSVFLFLFPCFRFCGVRHSYSSSDCEILRGKRQSSVVFECRETMQTSVIISGRNETPFTMNENGKCRFRLSSFTFKWTWSMALTATSRHQTIEIDVRRKKKLEMFRIVYFLFYIFALIQLNENGMYVVLLFPWDISPYVYIYLLKMTMF